MTTATIYSSTRNQTTWRVDMRNGKVYYVITYPRSSLLRVVHGKTGKKVVLQVAGYAEILDAIKELRA